jgi:uncharacterized membrane protein
MENVRHPVNLARDSDRTFGQRLADAVVSGIGTWTFLIVQFGFMAVWVIGNIYLLRTHPFDKYPFILLNLCLSVQAAVTGPLLLLAGNRQSAKDRDLADHDFAVNQKTLALIEESLQKLTALHNGSAPPNLHNGSAPPNPKEGGSSQNSVASLSEGLLAPVSHLAIGKVT